MIRLVVYVRKEISVKVRTDLMDPLFNSIWLEMGLSNKKKILISQVYREWQQLGAADTDSVPEQLIRWNQYLTIWERALNTGLEVINIGDFNLNHCNWTDPNVSKTSQTYKLKSLISELFMKILPYGGCQLVSGPTRFAPGQNPSGLDHIFTNTPDKISLVEKHHYGGSDHMLVSALS